MLVKDEKTQITAEYATKDFPGNEYGRTLLARGQAGDRHRALELLDQALAAADALGMAAVAGGARALQATQAAATSQRGPADAARPEVAGTVFRREGEYWTVAYEGSVVRLKDTKGLRHLARLLAHPARELLRVLSDLAAGAPRAGEDTDTDGR